MNEYKCKECGHKFELTKENKCPKCDSTNIEKVIPVFFGLTPPAEDSACEGGVCSFDKK